VVRDSVMPCDEESYLGLGLALRECGESKSKVGLESKRGAALGGRKAGIQPRRRIRTAEKKNFAFFCVTSTCTVHLILALFVQPFRQEIPKTMCLALTDRFSRLV
jgi:hypothetical protein